MDDGAGDETALGGRGVMLIDEFLRATGLDRPTAEGLVTDRKVEGLCRLDGQVFGIFDDVLPTKEELRSWGLKVRDEYDPERRRSYVGTDDNADASGGEEGTGGWTMTWDDSES